MAYTLPDLPYPKDALEPHIDAKTMEIHHGKHHAAYVNNLNKALEGHDELAKKSIEDLMRDLSKVPESIRNAVRNNGGGHVNHAMFWLIMKKGGGGAPKGELAKAIDKKFSSFDKLKEQVNNAGVTRFGSGWAWLALDETGELYVGSSANQDTPYSQGHTPILGVDVWEHAYYLLYQNRRPDYLAAWWNVVDWDAVAQRYADATR